MFVLAVMARAGGQLDKAHVLQGPAHRRFANVHVEFLMEPGNKVLDPPADHPMHSRDRAFLNNPRLGRAVVCG